MTRIGILEYIDISDLVFDIIVVTFTAFVLGRINPDGSRLVDVLTPGGIFALGMCVLFFITLYMGQLFRRYDERFDSPFLRGLMKFVFFLGITGAYLALILFFAAYRIMPWSGIAREMDIMIVLFPVFPLLWGLQCVFDYDELKQMLYVLYIPGTVAVPLVPISGCIVGSHTAWYLGLAAFVLFIACSALPFAVKWAFGKIIGPNKMDRMLALRKKGMDPVEIEETLRGKGGGEPLPLLVFRKAFTVIVIPCGAALAMLLWQNMTVEMLHRAYANWNLVAGADVVLLSLVLSGIVPLRVLSELAPPLRPANLVIASFALAYYMFALLRTVL